MRLPSKINSYNESVMPKLLMVLNILEQSDKEALSLYMDVKNKTEDVGDFVEILDCLFALGQIDYDKEKRALHYVSRD